MADLGVEHAGAPNTRPGGSASRTSALRAGRQERAFDFCHCVDGGLSAAFTNIVFLFSLSLITSLTFPHLPCDNSRGG